MFLSIADQTAQAQPSLTKGIPSSLIPGTTTEVTFHGSKLADPLTLWSPLGLSIEEIQPSDDQKSVTCKINTPVGQAVGVIAIVAANTAGISEPLLLMIDDLPPVVDNGTNHSLEKAQTISPAAVVHGHSEGIRADYYRLPLEAGQKISVEVVAQRIDSSMDQIVRVLDLEGHTLAEADDAQGLGADCRFQFTCDQQGDYFLEIRDSGYLAGGAYALRIGDFPIVTSTFPLGGRFGATNRFKFTGISAADAKPVILHVPEVNVGEHLTVNVKAVDGHFSSMVTLATSDLPEAIESEPNDQLAQGNSITVPCAVNGVFQNAPDTDCYEFAATALQRLDFTSYGRSLGTPAYAFLQLYDEKNNLVAASAVTDADELTLTYTPKQDGMLQLLVRDLVNRGGVEYAYRVEIRSGPDFSLALKQEKGAALKFSVPTNGGIFSLNVQSQRHGYAGPIRLTLLNADSRLKLYNAVIPAQANEVTLYVATPDNLEPGEFHALRIVGHADIGGREVRRTMHTESTLRAKLPRMLYPHYLLDGYLSLVATAAQEPFFSTTSQQAAVIFTQGTEQCEYVFSIERLQKEFKAALTVLTEGLPAGFKATVKSEKDKYNVTITGDKNALLGETQIRFVSIGKHKGHGLVDVQVVPVRVIAAEAEKGSSP